ncbi:MAG: hypothetical protein PHI34_12935 [Acidobacteriota bacterium]|nr:hypothetical protein [Acidobacteriota bacterium]
MSFKFEWNPFADQPHNVAPRSERMRHHYRRWPVYLALAGSNLVHGPGLAARYLANRRAMYRRPAVLDRGMFGVSVSPDALPAGETAALVREMGTRRTLFRVASWDRGRLAAYEAFARRLREDGLDVAVALLQRREDVFDAAEWADFVDEAFQRLGPQASAFEIGHAWNRTKWGVWDHTEYIRLARAAAAAAKKRGVKTAGPAVIDFEFHLYAPVLRAVEFDAVTSLLYVDRMGAPENAQAGWTAEKKFALFKAAAGCGREKNPEFWVTEVNWPLEGTGEYSPASGKPMVSEEAQADYLVRYYILGLASGLIDRIYWWQLAAPGYGLMDTRVIPARKRPSFDAYRTMIGKLADAEFVRRERPRGGNVFWFRKDGVEFAAAWTNGPAFTLALPAPPAAVFDRDGRDLAPSRAVRVTGHPLYLMGG